MRVYIEYFVILQRMGCHEKKRQYCTVMELLHFEVPIFRAVFFSRIEEVRCRMVIRICHDKFVEALGLQPV